MRMTLLWDNFEEVVFRPYLRKYHQLEKKKAILRSLWKNHYLPYLRKYQNSRKRHFSLEPFEKDFLVHMSKNINISRKMTLFWDYFEKFVFLPIYPKIATFWEKGSFFDISFKKLFFAHNFVNIKIQGIGTFL